MHRNPKVAACQTKYGEKRQKEPKPPQEVSAAEGIN
jgi:hypothetical protein